MAVADDGIDLGESGEFLRSALGVAAGDNDAGRGILAADAAHPGAGLAVCFRGDAAGIYNNDMRRIRCCSGGESVVAQVGSNGLAVGAAGAAAKVFNVIFCHVAQCINGRKAGDAQAILLSLKTVTGKLMYDPDTALEFL
jgi:hypothetical protein